MSTETRFERLCDDNLTDALSLYRTVFGRRVPEDYLRRKYDTAWAGVRHLTFLAYAGDRPIAFYGALPQRFVCGERSFLGVHTCDSITVRDHRGQGLHRQLALRAYELMREHGVRMVYAFHSDATLAACRKLSWLEAGRMRGYRIPVSTPPVANLWRRLPGLAGWHDRWARRLLAPFTASPDGFGNSHASTGAMCVAYSPEFFRYKSFTANLVVAVGEARAWIRVGAGLWVGDVHFHSADELWRVVAALRKMARRLGCNHLLFQTSAGTPLDQALAANWPGFYSWPVGYLPFDDNLPIERWRQNFGDLDTF